MISFEINYCTHESCRREAAIDLTWMAEKMPHRRRELIAAANELQALEVRCRIEPKKGVAA